jgi:hypothetical protein
MLFGISTAFPIAASLWSREAPAWIGALDVVLAFALVAAGGFIVTRWGAPIDGGVLEASARIYRGGSTLLLVLLVLFFLAGQRINWNILLPGLAWRGWLFAYVLPAWLAAWGGRQEVGGRR